MLFRWTAPCVQGARAFCYWAISSVLSQFEGRDVCPGKSLLYQVIIVHTRSTSMSCTVNPFRGLAYCIGFASVDFDLVSAVLVLFGL